MEEKKTFSRQIAVKTTFSELLEGEYVKEEEQNPNYLLTKSGEKIYRLNALGVILGKEKLGEIQNFYLDDGTGKIILRSFEANPQWEALEVGDTILVLGKLRVYNQEKYISPEIVKKIDPLWLKVRSLELKELFLDKKEIKVEAEEIPIKEIVSANESSEEELIGEDEIVMDEKLEMLPLEKVKHLIKELDQGSGVLIEELISKSSLNETEQIIEKMLEKGDIFQNLPGRVKVL
ncbi:MAG TPA: hypothetical protein VJA23_02845 [Candidatus Nanoarchaeia archaeon]|nr:hypothetical protein [Candidatus Nanoarchaeia archaeon]